jgi:hypothetical protein
MNHDALFKSLLRTGRLLRDFFEVFSPRIHRFIDFDHIEFMDNGRRRKSYAEIRLYGLA